MARRSPARVIGGRLLQALPVILLATFMVFALLKLVPGDIAVTLAGDNATDARITEIRKIYGLDRPFLVQYGAWLANVAQGDLSQSLLTGEKVATSIARAFPNTLLIVAIALVLALVTGIPMGVIAAIKPNGWVDKTVSMVASLGVAIPGFWLAMILVAEISLKLNWLPATGAKSFSASPWEAIRHALLPGIAIAAYGMAEVARQLRGSLLEVLSSQYVRTLHAKGLSMTRILWQHGLKNVSVNLFTIISLLGQPHAGGDRGDRGGVRHSRDGQPDRARRAAARFPDRAGRGVRHGDRGHRRQPDRRSAVRRRRSEDRAMTELSLATPKSPAEPGRLRRLFRWLAGDFRAALAILVLLVLVIVAIGAPWIAPYAPTAQDANNMLAAPGPGHLLGTDDLGRDIFSRLVYGAPATVYASLLAVGVAILIGLPVGLAAGFFGGWTDDIISRVIDTFLSFPAIVLAIAVTGALGIGLTNGMIAVGIVMFPALARIVRARTLIVRQELYVDASRCFGAPAWHILWKHVLPNALQPVIVQVTLLLAAALLAEASLSFLGLGIQPPNPSWGAMLARAYQYMEIAPEQMYAPGLAILVVSLAFNALGESLRIVLDPTMKDR